MVKITLIQTSRDRKDELSRFIETLNVQEGIDLHEVQLIFVDQGENREIFKFLSPDVKFVYIKTEPCSLSHARNIALQYVQGRYVGFPDDDCWYEPNTLAQALDVLECGKYDAVSGKGTNEKGISTSKFPNKAANITKSKRCAAISYTMFYRFEPSVLFDENMGVGSPYNLGSGEETDYMLTLIERFGYSIRYNPEIIVHHPIQVDIYDKNFLLKKDYSYARGGGYLMQKHSFPLSYYLKQFFRPFVGTLLFALSGNLYKAKKSHLLLKGRLEGYYFKKESPITLLLRVISRG